MPTPNTYLIPQPLSVALGFTDPAAASKKELPVWTIAVLIGVALSAVSATAVLGKEEKILTFIKRGQS